MHIVILGCGRVGTLLAHRLDELGHSVAVVDQDPKAVAAGRDPQLEAAVRIAMDLVASSKPPEPKRPVYPAYPQSTSIRQN